jgi:hypothetical protein
VKENALLSWWKVNIPEEQLTRCLQRKEFKSFPNAFFAILHASFSFMLINLGKKDGWKHNNATYTTLLTTTSVSRLCRKCEGLDVSEPYWSPRPVSGIFALRKIFTVFKNFSNISCAFYLHIFVYCKAFLLFFGFIFLQRWYKFDYRFIWNRWTDQNDKFQLNLVNNYEDETCLWRNSFLISR